MRHLILALLLVGCASTPRVPEPIRDHPGYIEAVEANRKAERFDKRVAGKWDIWTEAERDAYANIMLARGNARFACYDKYGYGSWICMELP